MSFEEFLEEKGIPFKKQGDNLWVEDQHLLAHIDEIKKHFPEISLDIEYLLETIESLTPEEIKKLKELGDVVELNDSGELVAVEDELINFLGEGDLEDWEDEDIWDEIDELLDSLDWEDDDWEDYWEEDDEPGSDSDIDK
jgi:hypothetical protein